MTTATKPAPKPATEETGELLSDRQLKMINTLLSGQGMKDRSDALGWINGVLGTGYTTRKDILATHASEVIDRLLDGEARAEMAEREALTDSSSVYEAVRRVTHDIGRIGVGKTGVNRDQHYNFRSIDDIINALSPILAKHGVVVVPSVRNQVYDYRPTKSGGTMMYATLTVDYRVYGPRGDVIKARVVGMGSDTSDKASNKALSAAFKYLLGQVFAIPQVGFTDGDYESPQIEHSSGYSADPYSNAREEPASDNAELFARVEAYAKQAGRNVEQFTAKFREQHNGITVEGMREMPRDLIYGFVRKVEAYQQQEAAGS